jgi:hypothetical protein
VPPTNPIRNSCPESGPPTTTQRNATKNATPARVRTREQMKSTRRFTGRERQVNGRPYNRLAVSPLVPIIVKRLNGTRGAKAGKTCYEGYRCTYADQYGLRRLWDRFHAIDAAAFTNPSLLSRSVKHYFQKVFENHQLSSTRGGWLPSSQRRVERLAVEASPGRPAHRRACRLSSIEDDANRSLPSD